MCGIAGWLHHAPDRLRIPGLNPDRMLASLRRRGPDAQGRFEEAGCGLLHARLAILDLDPRSNQPFVDERWALAYNGELFNYRQLKADLQAQGLAFQTTGDTEVLFKAIAHWGVAEAARRAAGMFAFAAYDRRERCLYLVRDRLAIKPLFVAESEEGVAFGSWPSSLLEGLERRWTLDRSAMADLFRLGAPFRGNHLVQGITEVPPGCIVRYRDGRRHTERYWHAAVAPRAYASDEFESLFEQVVHEHLESDVPSALFLSGGVDSSALAMAAKGFDCFHLHSEEREVAERVAVLSGGRFVNAELEHTEWSEELDELCRSTGQALSSAAQPMAVSRAISHHGYKMAFSANGADELFHGYSRTPGRTGLSGRDSLPFPFEEPGYACFADQVRHIFRSGENLVFPGDPERHPREAALRFLAEMQDLVRDEGLTEREQYRLFELRTYVAGDLNTTLDHASMYWSIEVRVPFLDHRLVEYALSLSPTELVTEEWGRKAPLKAYLRSKGVFESCWHRPKLGFSLHDGSKVRLRRQQLEALAALDRDGFVRFLPRAGHWQRDYAYILNAAMAFNNWKRVWIDNGPVSA